MEHMERLIERLQRVFEASGYFDLAFPLLESIGVRAGGAGVLVELDAADDAVRFLPLTAASSGGPELWVDLSDGGAKVAAGGREVHPAVVGAIERVFAGGGDASDRERIVFPCLFGFEAPEVLYVNPRHGVRCLKYAKADERWAALVTSGFSDPERGEAAFEVEGIELSGSGYELLLLTPDGNAEIERQFVDWTAYACRPRFNVVRDEYLEYEESVVPGTDLAGFIVVAPSEYPGVFPVGEKLALFNLLVGVTGEELERAKTDGVEAVGDALLAAGVGDVTVPKRGGKPVDGVRGRS